jgi:hypothetical protein
MEIYNKVNYIVKYNNDDLKLNINDVITYPDLINSAFITANNPYGNKLSNENNTKLNNKLFNDIINMNYQYLLGYGILDKWKEYSYLIKNITLDDSKYLAYKYNQIAFVYINRFGVVELIYS